MIARSDTIMLFLFLLYISITVFSTLLQAIENENMDTEIINNNYIEIIKQKLIEKEYYENNNTYCGKFLDHYQQLHRNSIKKVVYIPHTSGNLIIIIF